LAQRCVMTAPALTEQVDSLARDGFVRRLEDPNDRRVVLVELTAQGRRELDKYGEVLKRRVAGVLARLGAEKRARLRSALADLQETIEAIAEETANVRSDDQERTHFRHRRGRARALPRRARPADGRERAAMDRR